MFVLWILIFLSFNGYTESFQCRSGWSQHGESCYLFSHDRQPWHTSQIACSLFGGFLAEIKNADENHFITNEIKAADIKRGYWIGGNDLEVDGQFRWINSGVNFGFTNWARGRPSHGNNTENTNCVAIHYSSHKWIDDDCATLHFYLCEITPDEEPVEEVFLDLNSTIETGVIG